MQWYEKFTKENEPSEAEVSEYINSPLFGELDEHLRQTHKVKPKLAYSSCAMDSGLWKGWNIKYKKSSKSLCTVYPKQGYILALLPIGAKEMTEAELLMPLCTEFTRELFKKCELFQGGKYLGFEVWGEDVLQDMKGLIDIRVRLK
jgi:AraC family transcriptional regulator